MIITGLLHLRWSGIIAPKIRQDSEAREVMQVTIPTVIVQFQQGAFCNKLKYPNWYAQRALAVSAGAGTLPGLKRPWVHFLDLPGGHSAAESLATTSARGRCGEGLAVVWEAFWAASAWGTGDAAAAPERLLWRSEGRRLHV